VIRANRDGARVAMMIDTTVCTACRACESSCIEENGLDVLAAPPPVRSAIDEGPFGVDRPLTADAWTTLRTVQRPGLSRDRPPRWTFLKQQCLHCADAGCVTICPTNAQRQTPSGATWTDLDRCLGCAACVLACPFDVPRVHPVDGLARKCDLCTERIEGTDSRHAAASTDGGGPASDPPRAGGSDRVPLCVQTCPAEALHFGPRETIVARARERVAALRAQGDTDATIYGADEPERLGTIVVLPNDATAFGYPARPPAGRGALAGWTIGIAASILMLVLPTIVHAWMR